MTKIDFYTNVENKLSTGCRIVAKAYTLGHKVTVFCLDAEVADEVNRMLWTTPPTAFIPHCASGNALAGITPVVIDHRGEAPVHDQVLLNLCGERPAYFGRFERLIEIVGLDDEDRQRARERFRFYRDRGYELRTHDMSAAG
jgi:DNA polymerase III subunit chi